MPDSRDPAARPPVGVVPSERDVPRRAPEPAPPPPREAPPPAATLPPPLPKHPPPSQPQTTLPAPVRAPALPDPAPLERRLPAHKGKVGRIGDALTGLSEDLKEWVELRLQLVQTEIMEQVEFRAAQAKMGVAAGLFAALGGFFLLLALALLFGWLLFIAFGLSLLLAAFLGFLIVTLLLFLGAFVAYRLLKPPPPPSASPQKSA